MNIKYAPAFYWTNVCVKSYILNNILNVYKEKSFSLNNNFQKVKWSANYTIKYE